MRRFFAKIEGEEAFLSPSDERHLLTSLRGEVGEEIEIVEGGKAYKARIASRSPLRIAVDGPLSFSREPKGRLSLLFSPLKNGREELIIQKGTELGASSFFPYVSSRTVVRPEGDSARRKLERYRLIAKEASEQCRREIVPEVHEIMPFKKAIALAGGKRVYADEKLAEKGGFIADLLTGECSFLAGPEGGISDEERQMLSEEGYVPVSLGPRILRSETAFLLAASAFLLEEEKGK